MAVAGRTIEPVGRVNVDAAGAAADTGRPGRLAPVRVAPEAVTGMRVGLRPYRRSGFRVEAERVGDTVLVHNYGHGGCGVTLSWGTADLAARLALETPHRRAGVIGAGAVGLATARVLQDHGFQVTVYAGALPPDTTSDVAAALFGVTSVVAPDRRDPAFVDRLAEAARLSHARFRTLIGGACGVRPVELFLLGEAPVELPWEFAITPELHPLTRHLPGATPFPYPHVASVPTLLVETQVYLPKLMEEVVRRGGRIERRSFTDLSEVLALHEPLVVNASGLGARALFGDQDLIPVKGQLTWLAPQPEVDHAYLDPVRDLYMFPRSDGIVLGGSHVEGAWSMGVDPARAAEVLAGHRRINGPA